MPKLQDIRSKAHRAFDPLWERGYMSRQEAYNWMGSMLGLPRNACHISKLDEHQCYQLIRAAEQELDSYRKGKDARKHELKLWPAQFRAVQQGRKMYDLRRGTRAFREGDRVLYREFDPGTQVFTGQEIEVVISYVTQNAEKHGLEPGHVILGLSFPDAVRRAG